MSITDELRTYARGHELYVNYKLLEIADRIDAEHEADVSIACRLAAGLDNDALAKRGYIKLPVDADGVPIRPGDELVIVETGEHVRAYDVELYDDGRWCVGDYETMDSIHPDRLRHHAQTVEDVLDEFANAVLGCDNTEDSVQRVIAEYAAKLREVVG